MNSNDKKLKIAHVITRMIVGGAQENTLLSIRGQLENGNEVVLITGPSPGREGELLKQVDLPKFEIILCPQLVRELSLFRDLAALFKLRRLFKNRRFDIVHTHSSKAGIIARLAAAWAGVPVVVHTVHGQAFHPHEKAWRNYLYIVLERLAARCCQHIYAVAQAMIEQCVSAKVAPREKYMVVYSGMDTEKFRSAVRDMSLRARLGIPPQARVIAVLARLFPLKGYEYVLPAAAEVVKTAPDTHFLIIGDGPMYDELRRRLGELNLSEHFHFAGLVAPDRVADYLVQADLLWHLSLREGLPRAVVQALATGIPAIGFDLDGTPEVVLSGKTGFVVPSGNVAAVADRTLEFWRNDELRRSCGENGRRLVCEQFAWRRMADILEADYRRLLTMRD